MKKRKLYPFVAFSISLLIGMGMTFAQTMDTKNVQSGNGFIPNQGQLTNSEGEVAENVLFYSQTGLATYLKSQSFSYVLNKYEEKEQSEEEQELEISERMMEQTAQHRIDISFEGANENPIIHAEEKLSYYYNYYYGHCPDGITYVHPYKIITYKNVWNNIDVRFQEKQGGIEYDFVVHPGGNPNDIQLRYRGAEVEQISSTTLTIISPIHNINESIPLISQNGEERTGNYVLNKLGKEDYLLQFEVEDYNPLLALVIDPWATYYGGSSGEEFMDIATDGNNNLVVTGETSSGNFPVSPGAVQTSHGGGNPWDAVIVKFDPLGNRLWATYYGGSDEESTAYTAIDALNNVLVTGHTRSINFPVGAAAGNIIFQPGYAGGLTDAFILKLNGSGAREWATFYGGTGTPFVEREYGTGIAVDPANNNIFITGSTITNGTFPILSLTACQSTYASTEAFLLKFEPNGNRLWATFLGGSGGDYANDICVDPFGNAIVVGSTSSSDFPGTAGQLQPAYNGSGDGFIAKYDNNNATCNLLWATYLGGSGGDVVESVSSDSDGNILVTGGTRSNDFPVVAGALQATASIATGNNPDEAFISKLNGSGNILIWSTYYGGSEGDYARSICADMAGNALVTGTSSSNDLLITSRAIHNAGGGDGFLLKLSKASGDTLCATYLGGSAQDVANGVAVDNNGFINLCGSTSSNDFPVNGNVFQPALSGSHDAFVGQFCSPCGEQMSQALIYQDEIGEILDISDSIEICGGDTLTLLPAMDLANTRQDTLVAQNMLGDTVIYEWYNVTTATPIVNNAPADIVYLSATGDTLMVSPASIMSYELTIKYGSCSDKTQIDFKLQGKLLTPEIEGLDDVCAGESMLMTASTAEGDVGFEWYNKIPATSVIGNNPTFQTGILDKDTTFYLGVYRNACTSDLDTLKIDIFPLAVMKFDALGYNVVNKNVAICAGESITLQDTASVLAKDFFAWTNENGDTLSFTNSLALSPTVDGKYYLTVRESGCINKDSITITVNPLPVPNAGTDRAICAGESTTIGSSLIIGNTYNWSTPQGFSSMDVEPVVNPTDTTTYTLVQTIDATGCSASDEVEVWVNPLPTPNAGVDVEICNGESITIGSALIAGNTYSWTSSPAGFASADAEVEVSPTITTTYTLLQIIDATGCEASDNITVTVKELPIANAGNDPTLCGDAIVTLGTAEIVGNTYSWSPQTNLNDAAIAQPTFTGTKQHTETLKDTFYLEVTGANGCLKEDSVFVTTLANPLANAGADQNIDCENFANLLASATMAQGPYSYSWKQVGGSNGPNTAAWNNVGAGTYAITVFDQNLCFDRDTTVVSLAAGNLTATPSANPGTICDGEQTTLTVLVSNQQGAPTITWTSPDTTFSGTGPHFMEPNATTTYNVNVSDEAGCEVDVPLTVTVNPTPIPVLSSANLVAQGICANEELVFTVSPSDLTNYKFTLDGNEVQNGASNTYTASTITPANYNLEVTVVNSFGCQASTTLNYTVFELPTVDLGEDLTVVCEQTRTLVSTPSGGEGTYSFSWLDENTTELSTTNTLSDVGAGTYTLNIEDGNGCTASDELAITNTGNPMTLSLTASPADICVGEESTITAILNGENGSTTYTWNEALTGTGPHTVGPSTTTTYTLQVSDDFGCEANAEVELVVNDLPIITLESNSANDSYCEGEEVIITVSPDDLISYEYFINNAATSNGVSNNTLTRDDLVPNNYTVKVIGSNGCESEGSLAIVVNPTPSIAVVAPEITICLNEEATLEVSDPQAGHTYTWKEQGGAQVGTGAQVVVSPTEQTTYEVEVINEATTCSNLTTVEVTVDPLPIASFLYEVKNLEVTFMGSDLNTITDWEWNFGDRTAIVKGNQNPVHFFNQLGIYTIQLIVENPCGIDTTECAINVDGSTYSGTNCEQLTGIYDKQLFDAKLEVYPNPYHHSTTIHLEILEGSEYSLEVVDVLGRKIQTLMPSKHLATGDFYLTLESQAVGTQFILLKQNGKLLKVNKVESIR